MTYGIYCIRNTATNDCYVGASATIELHWEAIREDLETGKHISTLLAHHWEIYGADAFVWEIVEKTKPIPAVKLSRLRYWQKKLKATYNSDRYSSKYVGKSGVYRILNTVTSECYIGASRDIEARWDSHRRSLNKQKHHSKKLQDSWNCYGANQFLFEVIEECSENLREQERDWVLKLKPRFNTNRP